MPVKPTRKSAGLLVYKLEKGSILFFLVHPGGPFWSHKDAGAWSIPKGEFLDGEEGLQTAIREFREETGQEISGTYIPLAPIRQKAGKWVWAWLVEGHPDATRIVSNTYKVEWPYKSGKWQEYPEVDKAGWFTREEACEKINPAQAAFIQEGYQLILTFLKG